MRTSMHAGPGAEDVQIAERSRMRAADGRCDATSGDQCRECVSLHGASASMVTYRLSRSWRGGFGIAMPLFTSTDPTTPASQRTVTIPEPQLVRARGLFVAEGRLVVERLIEDGRCTIQSLLLSPAARRSLEPMLAAIRPDTPIYVCEARDFLGITGFDCIEDVSPWRSVHPSSATCELLRDAQTLVILEGVTNADNVGGVFRNVAAFGADAVMLSPTCCDPLYRKAIRTSMGTTLRVPFATTDDWPSGLGDVRATGFTLVALTPHRGAQPIDAFLGAGRPQRVALLVGTEGAGLSETAESAAEARVRIPTTTMVDSLNLAVATGIVLARLSSEAGLW